MTTFAVNRYILGLLCLIFIFCFLRFQVNFPITYQEANESFNSYSLIKIGKDINEQSPSFVFKGFNDYPSPLAIYFRIPFIAIFGLDNLGVRLPTIIVGFINILLFTLIALRFNNLKKTLGIKVIIIFLTFLGIYPAFIYLSIFDLSTSLALMMGALGFLAVHKAINEKRRRFYFLGIVLTLLALFADLNAYSIITILIAYYGYTKYRLKGLVLGLIPSILLLILALFNLGFKDYLLNNSFLKFLSPTANTWLIDRRLAFDKVQESPLRIGEYDFNRLIHNKPAYLINSLFINLIIPFDFEKIIYPLQSHSLTLLRVDDPTLKSLPKMFFVDIIFIFIGLIVLINRKTFFIILTLLISTLVYIGKGPRIDYLFPGLVFFLVFGLYKSIQIIPKKFRIHFIFLIVLIYVFSFITFADLLIFHKNDWIKENDMRQSQIWNFVLANDEKYQQITTTDKLGEPAVYYLYYSKFNPSDYKNKVKLGGFNNEGVQKVEKIDKYKFSTFKYLESDRLPGQLWIGLADEFVGKFHGYKGVTKISDGIIVDKIRDVNQTDQLQSDELWVVETYFKKEK